MSISRSTPRISRPGQPGTAITASAGNLWCLSITTPPESEDAVAELFHRVFGALPVITHALRTGLSTTAVYLDTPPFSTRRRAQAWVRGLLAILKSGLSLRPARLRCTLVPPADWRESWKRHFRPLSIGRHLLVRPSWSRRRPVPGAVEVVLDPGLSFGTGQHPTTEFCLRELVRLRPVDAAARGLLDAGTGSGILAIAAARLGYSPVDGFDHDPEAVRIARGNAEANGVLDKVRLLRADLTAFRAGPAFQRCYDVLCANLTADLLDRHADLLASRLREAGHLVLAGILVSQFAAVRRRIEALGLRLVRSRSQAEWRSGTFRRG